LEGLGGVGYDECAKTVNWESVGCSIDFAIEGATSEAVESGDDKIKVFDPRRYLDGCHVRDAGSNFSCRRTSTKGTRWTRT
jgi:hypothetical protein